MGEIILILVLQLVYVPILAIRTIFMVKKMTAMASVLGMLEALIYVFGLSLVFSGDQSTVAMVVYAVGFSLGIILGGYIEEKLAVGYSVFRINIEDHNEAFIAFLREEGYGVTVYKGEGRTSPRYELSVLIPRNKEKALIAVTKEYEPNAFVICYEPKRFLGGFMLKNMKK